MLMSPRTVLHVHSCKGSQSGTPQLVRQLSVCSVARLFLTLCDPMDYSLSGSSVHAVSQARTLERAAVSSSRGSCRHRDRTSVSWVSCISRQILYRCTTWEVLNRGILCTQPSLGPTYHYVICNYFLPYSGWPRWVFLTPWGAG